MRTYPAAVLLAALFALPALAADDDKDKDAAKPDAAPKTEITVKGAKGDEAAKAKLRADALLARCVIRPVMTDEEIDLCKSAYAATRGR